MATSFFKKEDLYVKVVYGQPNKKGRQVFGTLVPYGEVWRTGANEATEFTTTKDIRLAGKSLRAGTYTIFTVPDREKWTVIVNAELGQWGEYKYKDFKSKDVLTFETPAQRVTGEIHEAFTIKFLENTNGADMVMQWDDTKVAVPISVGAVSTGKTSKKKGK
ncbi:MAG: DUF2911 domain-containing protein [Verrucomicrobia bacterium]|nr:DUF2911 domain-containing protein [Cytophagales bacterium]